MFTVFCVCVILSFFSCECVVVLCVFYLFFCVVLIVFLCACTFSFVLCVFVFFAGLCL